MLSTTLAVLMEAQNRLDKSMLHLCRVQRVEMLKLLAGHGLRSEHDGLVRMLDKEVCMGQQHL